MLSIKSSSFSLHIQDAQRRTQSSLSTTLSRLSSGLRIVHAKDDVAGSMISERLTAQVRGALQSTRNAMDGISLLQVMEGAFGEQTQILQRMRELAVYAASEHLSDQQRVILDEEFKELQATIDLISEHTQYNGISLFNRSQQVLQFQIGEDAQDSFSFGLYDARAQELGRQARYEGQRRGGFIGGTEDGQLTLNGVEIRGTEYSDDLISYSHANGSAIAKANAINAATEYTGVRAIVGPTVITSFEPLRPLELTPETYFKINGVAFSGFSFEAKDATGTLVQQINAEYDQTGVVAELTEDGHLTLTADDGRNITLEYSELAVRDAIRMVDVFGDPINLVNTVDPLTTVLDGDLEAVSFVLSGDYDPQDYEIIGDVSINGQNFQDDSGGFISNRDRSDLVLEVVNPGEVGVATFRIKEETNFANGTVDAEPEDFRFNGAGTVTVSDPSRLVLDPNTYYNEGNTREFELNVIRGGFVDAVDPNNRPLFNVVMTNPDEATDTANLGPFEAHSGSPIDLGYGVHLDFVVGSKSVLDNGRTIGNGGRLRPPDVEDPNHTYTRNPQILSWDGDRNTDFTLEVIGGGHAVGNGDLTGVANAPDQATLRITASETNTGVVSTQDFDLVPNQVINFAGLRFRMSYEKGVVNVLDSRADAGLYAGSVLSSSQSVFVGEETRYYRLTALNDSVVSNAQGPTMRVDVLDSDQATVLDSHNLNLRANTNHELGTGSDFEGVRVRFGASVSSTTDQGQTNGNYEGVGSFNGIYTGESTEKGILRITREGQVGGDAEYEYFYEDDPGTILQSGTLRANQALEDGISFSITSPDPDFTLNQTAGVAVRFSASGNGYTEAQDASVISEVVSVGGIDTLRSIWSFDDGSTRTVDEAINLGGRTSMGFGVEIQIDDRPDLGSRFSGQVDVALLERNDRWEIDLNAREIKTGDEFYIRATPRSLQPTTRWEFEGVVPEWEAGDRLDVVANHNFYSPIRTLSEDVPLLNAGGGEIGSTLRLTGNGSFNTGDEIRLQGRSFVGTATSSGFYTHNLYPTHYIVTITESGPIGNARFDWVREDLRTDTERGGSGSGVSATNPTLLEEGVFIHFDDNGQDTQLNVGDQFIIPVGLKLEYTFGGHLTLQSSEEILIEYDELETDNQFGRFLYEGPPEGANEAGVAGHILQGTLDTNVAQSFETLSLLNTLSSEEAIDTLDVTLNQIGQARSQVGATLNQLQRRIDVLNQKVEQTSHARQRIQDADLASESVDLIRSQTVSQSQARLSQVAQLYPNLALDLLAQSLI